MHLMQLDVSGLDSPIQDGLLDLDDNASPLRGPPSETSSQEWDRVTDPDSQSAS